MRKWQAIPVAAVTAFLAGAALFGSAPPTATRAAGEPVLLLECRVQVNCTFASAPATIDVDVKLANGSGAGITVGGFQFDLYSSDAQLLTPVTLNNPAENTAFLVTAGWNCASDPRLPDTGAYTSTGGTASHISCFNGSGSESVVNGDSPILATVQFTVAGNNTADLLPINVVVSDGDGVQLIGCTPADAAPTQPTTFLAGAGSCTGATVAIGGTAATNTPLPTSTPVYTPVPTRTPCVGANCPAPTSLAYVTITPNAGTQTATAPTVVPATAVPGGPPPPPATGGGQPTGNQGGAGAGGARPVRLPDTGAGAGDGIDWMASAMLSLLAVAIGGATGALYFGAAHVSASRRGRDN